LFAAMDLLGGYGSDDSEGEDGAPKPAIVPKADVGFGAKRKKVDISRLPTSRPLLLDSAVSGDVEAPLAKKAALENVKPTGGLSLLSSLPAPRATLGADVGVGGGSSSGGLRLDLSGMRKPKEKPTSSSLPAVVNEKSVMQDRVREVDDMPLEALGHRMFNNVENGPCKRVQDGPSIDDLDKMRSLQSFTKIAAEELQNPNWSREQAALEGGPGLHKGKSVPMEMSQYDSDRWKGTTHANPNRTQKRKHQINWLASEAMEKEAEMLDRNAQGRLTKAQTSAKYGW